MSQPVHPGKMAKPPVGRVFWTERRRSALTAYMYISPFFILFAIFGIFPVFFTFYLSFFRWDALGPMTFVGFENYGLVLNDKTFWISVLNTLLIGLMGTVPQLICALLLAVALNSAVVRFKKLFRALYFMPVVTSLVALTLVFGAIFGNQGMINQILDSLGRDMVPWNSGWWEVKIAIAIMIFWRWTGYNAVIYLAGLQSIPHDLYEAARIDGAGPGQILWKITIPLLKPFIIFTVIMSSIGILQLFTEPYVFLGQSGTGSTRREGITMVIYLYREAFINYWFGTAAAVAVILFFFTILFSLFNYMLSSRLGSGFSSTGGAR